MSACESDRECAAIKAQLEAVRRERDEVKLYLTQERANRESLESCVDRDVQKMKDLQALRDERDRLREALDRLNKAVSPDVKRIFAKWVDEYPFREPQLTELREALLQTDAALTPAARGTRHG